MKKLSLIAWVLILLGIAFKLLHFPAAALLIIVGNLLFVFCSVSYIFLNLKVKDKDAFLYFMFAVWSIYFLFRFQYWYGGEISILNVNVSIVFLFSFLITFIYVTYRLIVQVKFKIGHLIFIVFFVSNLLLSFTPAYKIFYFVHLNELINSDERDFNYLAWDKYSWFLYVAGEKDKAIDANEKAQDACRALMNQDVSNIQVEKYYEKIKTHEIQIYADTWSSYQ